MSTRGPIELGHIVRGDIVFPYKTTAVLIIDPRPLEFGCVWGVNDCGGVGVLTYSNLVGKWVFYDDPDPGKNSWIN